MFLEQEQYLSNLSNLRNQLREIGEGLRIDDLERELSELREEMSSDGFWDNLERSAQVNQRMAAIERKLTHYRELVATCDDVEIMIELADEENDADLIVDIGEAIDKLAAQVEALGEGHAASRAITLPLEGLSR